MQITLYLLISVVITVNSKVINKISCNGNACEADVVNVRTHISCPSGYINKNNEECIRDIRNQNNNNNNNFILKCPDDYELNGDHCVSKDLQRCPSGFIEQKDKCVKLKCPYGYKLSTTEKKCIYDDSICPQNYILSVDRCIPLCPHGYELNKNRSHCVYDEKTCPPNYVFNGSQCVRRCPIGYNVNMIEGLCVAE